MARKRRGREGLALDWRTLSVYLLGVFLGALDTNVIAPIFPLLEKGFHITLGWTAWTVTAYTVSYAVATVMGGALGDRLGHRPVFEGGLVAFGVASVLTPFALGAAGSNNVVQASGQTIALPQGDYSTLSFLAVGVNGNQPNLTFTVTYTDGTTQTLTQSISDWYTPQSYSGESIAATMSYRDTSSGSKDLETYNVYGYSFALDPSKTVQSITLPNDGNVDVLALDLS